MDPTLNDIFPTYDSQDLSAFAVLMIHRAASRLGLTGVGHHTEENLRAKVEAMRPGIPSSIDQVMHLYEEWNDAKKGGASLEILQSLQLEIEKRRKRISATISN